MLQTVQKAPFPKNGKKQLDSVSHEHIMIIGDYNGSIESDIDPTIPKKKKFKNWELPKSFLKLVEKEGLIDIWRKKIRVIEITPIQHDIKYGQGSK